MNFNYEHVYLNLYKKLPVINGISAYVLVIVWAIVDWVTCTTAIGYMEFLGFLIWLGIGGVFALLVALFTMLQMSATIVRTDAAIEMKKSMKNQTQSQPNLSQNEFHDLPEL